MSSQFNKEAAAVNNVQGTMENMDIDAADDGVTIIALPHPDTLLSMNRSLSEKQILPTCLQDPEGTSTDAATDDVNNGSSASATINEGPAADSDPSANTTSTSGLEEGTYVTSENITVKLAFKVRRTGHILPPGKVELRIFFGNGQSRLIVVDEADVAGMGLRRIEEKPKKRLLRQQRMREMGLEVAKRATPRKILLEDKRRKMEDAENDTQKMAREWREKRELMGFNKDWSVNEAYTGDTFVGEDGKTYATMRM
ncbi:hypothetical protein BZA77DRAFT_357093 [Pyronema omphalodes]|nr:hypothetical protein BZA77DRAFT_357093 [Pyronema omphalodes]